MTRVLFVGQKPETVDFSDPALPPHLNAAKIQAGIEIGTAALRARGWEANLCMIAPDETAGTMLAAQLTSKPYDCVVTGAGLRLPAGSVPLFEMVINAVRLHAPGARIAFNTRPEDTADAAARWVE